MKNSVNKLSNKEFKFYNLEFYNQQTNQIEDFDFEKLLCQDSMSKFVKIKKHVFYLFESHCMNGQITGVICKMDKKTFNRDKDFIEQNFQIADSFLKKNSIMTSHFVFDFSKENHLALETTNKVIDINDFICFIESIFPNIGIDKYALEVNSMEYLKANILSITDISFKIKKESLGSLQLINYSLWETLNTIFDLLNCSEFSFSSNVSSISSSKLSHKTIESLIEFIVQNPAYVNNLEKLKICFMNKHTNMLESYHFFGKTNYSQIVNSEKSYICNSDLNHIENKLNCYKQTHLKFL